MRTIFALALLALTLASSVAVFSDAALAGRGVIMRARP